MKKRDIVILFIRLLAVFLAAIFTIDLVRNIGQGVVTASYVPVDVRDIKLLLSIGWMLRAIFLVIIWIAAPVLAGWMDGEVVHLGTRVTAKSILPAALSVVGVLVCADAVFAFVKLLSPGRPSVPIDGWKVVSAPVLQFAIGLWLFMRPRYAERSRTTVEDKVS